MTNAWKQTSLTKFMRKHEIYAVIGSLFGDEGKGHTVQLLCEDAIRRGKNPVVVRFSGGSQAAHTVSDGKVTHICSSYGSGVLDGVDTIVYDSGGFGGVFNHAYFDPIAAVNERNKLIEEYKLVYPDMKVTLPKIYVSTPCRLITPYDMFNDRNDNGLLSDGTCGSGQWGCHKRYQTNILFESISYTMWYENKPYDYLKTVRSYYCVPKDVEAEDCFVNAFQKGVFTFVTHDDLQSKLNEYDVVILEGSQGLLLDADRGFYPHVTSTNVGVEATFSFIKHVLEAEPSDCQYYFVTRTYLTRHGNGYEPREFFGEEMKRHFLDETTETNKTNQYQGDFKVGFFEPYLFREAFARHTLDNLQKKHNLTYNLVITHLDKLYKQPVKFFAQPDNNVVSFWSVDEYLGHIVKSTAVNFNRVFTTDSPSSEFCEQHLETKQENSNLS